MKTFLVIASLLIAISIACSSYKSASSPTPANSLEAVTHAASPTPEVVAQEKTPCTLTLPGAPEIKGLRLGMTADEVLALFPGSREDADVRSDLARPAGQFGTSNFLIRPAKYESKEKFTGISQISFMLLDGRVSKFTVQYSGPEYSHVDKFVSKVVEDTNLPSVNQWEAYVGMDNQVKTLTCADFEVRAFIGGSGGILNNVSMRDLVAQKKLHEREAKANEQPTPKK